MSGSASQVEKSCLGRQEQRSLLKKEVRKVVETVWTEPPGKELRKIEKRAQINSHISYAFP